MCTYTTFRGFDCCTCLATWLPVFEDLAQARGDIDGSLKILQLRGGNPASAGTHAEGGVFDLGYYHDGQADALVWISRQMGADATWFREWDGNNHVHGVLTGCPRNDPAAYQIEAVKDGYDGLGYMGQEGPDDGPRPLSGRTWEQGIEWAGDQMALSDDDIRRIWFYGLEREGDGPWSASSWVTLAATAGDEARKDLNALQTRVDALEAGIADAVWAKQIARETMGPYQAASWLTLAGSASDEVRDDVNELGTGVTAAMSHPWVVALAILALCAVAVLALVLD